MSTSTEMGVSSDPVKRGIEQEYERRDVEVVSTDANETIDTYDVMACSPWCAPTL